MNKNLLDIYSDYLIIQKGQHQNLNSLNLKDGEIRTVCLKNCPFSVALITKIFKNEYGSTGTLYLDTNDLESSADRIYEVYKKRWRHIGI